jgi:hypothetical protein
MSVLSTIPTTFTLRMCSETLTYIVVRYRLWLVEHDQLQTGYFATVPMMTIVFSIIPLPAKLGKVHFINTPVQGELRLRIEPFDRNVSLWIFPSIKFSFYNDKFYNTSSKEYIQTVAKFSSTRCVLMTMLEQARPGRHCRERHVRAIHPR